MPRYQSGPSPAITALLLFSLDKSSNSAATVALIWSTETLAKRGLIPPCRYIEPLIFTTALCDRIHLPYLPLGPNSIRCSNHPSGCSASHFLRSASAGGAGRPLIDRSQNAARTSSDWPVRKAANSPGVVYLRSP